VVGRDCSVGIATRYGLDDPGIEWTRFFAHLQTGPGAHTVDTGSLMGVKLGRGVD